MLRYLFRLLPILCLPLAACGGGGGNPRIDLGPRATVECAPFARALTGVSLTGDAADWWTEADGRYDRSHQPQVGSVLVLRRSGRLPHGHVSVVSRVVSRRQIMVTQANWVHDRITEDQPVIDVSDDNDWSIVRVWWPPTGAMGVTDYAAAGFIRPERPLTPDRIAANTPSAVRIAQSGW
jgi:hypothetical protein